MTDSAFFCQTRPISILSPSVGVEFFSFGPEAVAMACPYRQKATLEANNFVTAGRNMMIDIAKESSGRALVRRIILVKH